MKLKVLANCPISSPDRISTREEKSPAAADRVASASCCTGREIRRTKSQPAITATTSQTAAQLTLRRTIRLTW